ncbi:MAG: hypothetical protein AB7G23_19260 [Vicinamibacterales bacterium]
MGLEIIRNAPAPLPGLVADRRLCLTADRGRMVEERDPEAAYLLAAPGDIISAADVARYGLVRAEDGTIQVAPAADTSTEPPKSSKGGKGGKPGSDA